MSNFSNAHLTAAMAVLSQGMALSEISGDGFVYNGLNIQELEEDQPGGFLLGLLEDEKAPYIARCFNGVTLLHSEIKGLNYRYKAAHPSYEGLQDLGKTILVVRVWDDEDGANTIFAVWTDHEVSLPWAEMAAHMQADIAKDKIMVPVVGTDGFAV